ncbi:MAG: hypothetical protein U0996_13420 [Planctomycetaceae bacterium]
MKRGAGLSFILGMAGLVPSLSSETVAMESNRRQVAPTFAVAQAAQETPTAPARPQAAPAKAAFVRMSPEQVHENLIAWLAVSKADQAGAAKALQLWADQSVVSAMTAEESLDRLIASLAEVDTAVQQLVDSCRTGGPRPLLTFEGVRSENFYRNHVQLWYARWLTQHRLYDDALTLLEPLKPEEVADPASLFFYRAVCRLRLLKPDQAADDLVLLLNNTTDVPARFRAVAEMMREEAGIPADGLPQIARLMSDVQRRLDLGKSDDPVQKREEEVIAALDKLLKDMEQQQQQQQQQQGGGGGGSNQPSTQPAGSSGVKGAAGEGDADRKELTENGAWGMLDKQQEAQARELIRQQFPPNFLDAISRYTRRIAEQKK